MEDSIIISETAARKLGSMLISTCEISLNNNDIMLNLYGDDSNYKTYDSKCGTYDSNCETYDFKLDTYEFMLAIYDSKQGIFEK